MVLIMAFTKSYLNLTSLNRFRYNSTYFRKDMEGWDRIKCPASFVQFYEVDCLQLVDKLGNTPKKGKSTESMAQTEARHRREMEREEEPVSSAARSGSKSCATANFNNRRNALYSYLGGRSGVITLRDWVRARYDDKKKFAEENFVS